MFQYVSNFTADAIPVSRTCLSAARSHPVISLGASLGAIYLSARVLLSGVKLYTRPRERFEVLTRAEGLLLQREGAGWHTAAIFEVMSKMDELGLTDRVPDTIDRLERRLCEQVNVKLRRLVAHPDGEHTTHVAVLMVGVACSLMNDSQIQVVFGSTAVNPRLVGVVRQCAGCWKRRGGRPLSTPIDMDALSKVVVLASSYTHTGKDITATWNMPWSKVPTVIRAWKAVFLFCDHRWLALWVLIAVSTASYGTLGRLRTGHILPSLSGYSSEASTTIQSVKGAVSRQVGVPSSRLPDLEYLLYPLTSPVDVDPSSNSGSSILNIGWALVAVVGPVLLWTTVKELFDNAWAYFESVLRLQLSRSMETRILLRAASADTAVLQSASNVRRKGGVDFARATVAAISEVSTFFFTVESSLNGHMTKLVASLCLWRYPTAVIFGGCGVMFTSWYTRRLWLVLAEAIAVMDHNAALPKDVVWREHLVRHGTEVLYEGAPHCGEDAVDSHMRLFHPRPVFKCHTYWDCLSSSLTDPTERTSTDRPPAHFGLSLLVSATKDHASPALCTIMGNTPPCKWSALVVVAGGGSAQSSSLMWAREAHALATRVSALSTSHADRWVLKAVTIPALGDLRGYCARVCPPESRTTPTSNDTDADPSHVVIGLPTTSYSPPASELYGCLRWVGAARQHTMVTTAMEAARAISDDHTQGWWNFFTSRLRGQVATLADQIPSIAAAAQVKGSAVMSPAVAATAVDTATLILTNLDILKRQETRLDRSPPPSIAQSPLDKPLGLLFRMVSSRHSRRAGVLACASGANALGRVGYNPIPPQMAGVVHYGSDSTNDGVWEAMASLLEEDTRGTSTAPSTADVDHETHPTHCLDWYALSPNPCTIEGGMWEGSCSGWSIEFKNVCFSYTEHGPNILEDLSFTLPAGALCGLVGPSGTGKSTILSLILMIYAPTKGSVLLQGVDTRELMAVRAARRRIGYYGDMSPLLAHSTISENIALGDAINLGMMTNPDDRRHAVEKALKQSEAYSIVATRGNGLLTEVGVQSGFSGGEEQRMLLARALVKPQGRVNVLLLDEPTSALDSDTEARVLANLRNHHHRDATVVIATHKLVALRDAGWIVVLGASLDTGATTVVEQGSWSALSTDPSSKLRVLLDLQGTI